MRRFTTLLILSALLPIAAAQADLPPFADLAAGGDHALALDADGRVWAWGRNDAGQLGDGTVEERATPVRVAFPDGVAVRAVFAGTDHSLALDADGALWAWGDNRYGALGDGSAEDRRTPVRVRAPEGVAFVAAVGGSWVTIALDADGRVWAWGDNVFGQLGDGGDEERARPERVALPADLAVASIDGYDSFFAIGTDGALWGWGANYGGEVDPDSFDKVRTPRRFPFGSTVLERIAAGFDFVVAIDDAGRAWAWGYDGPGSLGTGAPPRDAPTASPQAVALPDGTRAVDVAAGVGHAAVLDQDGSIWSWGIYATSEAQGGFAPPRYRPEAIAVPGGGRFVQVHAGDAFVLALDDAGRAWAWGSNERGTLGDDTTASRLEPRPVGRR